MKNKSVIQSVSKHLILLLLVILSSCRVAKKDWVKETFAEKQELTKLEQSQSYSTKTLKTEISESLILEISEKLKQDSKSTSENESTTISGSIKAEEGKEKSVTVGNTTIKSNGANVSFTTTSSISKEFESKYMELEKNYNEQSTYIQNLESKLTSLETEFANFRSTYESEKTTKTKTVKKTGFQFGVWIIIAIVVIVIILLWCFRKSIPFLR